MGFYGFDSEEEFLQVMAKVVDSALVGICIYDADGNFIFHNKAHEDLSGYTKEMLGSFTAQNLKHMERYSNSSTLLVLESKEEVLVEQNMIPTGKQFLTKGIPWFNDNNQLKYVISNIIDLSRASELENKLRNEAERFQKVQRYANPYKETKEDKNYIIFHSQIMRKLIESIAALKNSDATVLLKGDSGTGKELFAQLLHDQSNRKDKPFVKINCCAIPESLIESELFGYEGGSFTGGSMQGKDGLLQYANQGTVLLDEIGDMPISLQAKILRVIEEKEIQKIGKLDPIKVDIRFIASTNVDLSYYVKEGKFREDLFYRLNVIPISIPNLSERVEDIPLLVRYFGNKYNRKYGLSRIIPNEVISMMMKFNYPGNVRQLENLVERLVLLSGNEIISIDDLNNLRIGDEGPLNQDEITERYAGRTLNEIMENYEKQLLIKYITKFGSISRVAKELQVDRSTISRKCAKYNIHV